jgi:outer membrane lipopolysaccharide assembly protein LptE/RlpB
MNNFMPVNRLLRTALLVLVACNWSFQGQAQAVQSKQIFLWDVTLSMEYNGMTSLIRFIY